MDVGREVLSACRYSEQIYCQGEITEALAVMRDAYDLVRLSSDSAIRCQAARLLATRLRDQDLRSNWQRIHELLDDAIAQARCADVTGELAQSSVLLADCAQCRRDFDLAARMTTLASKAAERLDDGFLRRDLLAQLKANAACRYGRTDPEFSRQSIQEGLAIAPDRYRRSSLQLQKAYLALPDCDAAIAMLDGAEVDPEPSTPRDSRRPWHALKAEKLFTRAVLAFRGKRLPLAIESGRASLAIAMRTGSIEVEAELRVLLTACLFAARSNGEAEAMARSAEALCRNPAYDDLDQDLKIVTARASAFRRASSGA